VGACVSPILILALGAAITQGDPVLGAAIMGSMAIGMGLLLILFGFGAGWILPKTGAWMNQIQILFGFMVLGVAIYLLSALPYIPALYLWAGLLLCAGFYVWHISGLINAGESPLFASASKAISVVLIAWGLMALVGGTTGGKDILQPLESLTFSDNAPLEKELAFNVTTTLSQVEALMQSAKQSNQPVLIDFYADWCLDCKRMQRTTFKRASVHQALSGWTLIEINVTETNDDSEQVKRLFNVFGPPATLFFKADGQEREDLRQYGYIKEAEFLTLVKEASN
jgi:thiol:disulfide interchange protein DsbD